MDIASKVEDVRGDLRLKRLKGKLKAATTQAQLLQEENRVLHEELDRQTQQKSHPLRRLIWITIGGGCAYLMGAKAGRERYEQAREWARLVTDRGMNQRVTSGSAARAVTDARTAVAESAIEVGQAGQEALARSQKAVRTATERVGDAAKDAVAGAPGDPDARERQR